MLSQSERIGKKILMFCFFFFTYNTYTFTEINRFLFKLVGLFCRPRPTERSRINYFEESTIGSTLKNTTLRQSTIIAIFTIFNRLANNI